MRDEAPFGVVVNPSSALGRGARVATRVLAAFEAAGVHAIEISGSDAADCQARVRAASRGGLRGLVLVGGGAGYYMLASRKRREEAGS